MNDRQPEKDLVVLAADKNIEMTIRGLLTRSQSLKICPLSVEYIVHPEHDPGCRRTPEIFLRPYAVSFQRALVVMDHEGSGDESIPRMDLELKIETRLEKNGWEGRVAAIVIEPELENWVWSNSPEVDNKLGWRNQPRSLRLCLQEKNFWPAENPKPNRPKEAMTWALGKVHKPRSSAIYQQLAECVSLERCSDPAFHKLRETLRNWFPAA